MTKRLNFFNLFQNRSKFFFPFLGILGIINGLWASALLLLINKKLTNAPLPFFNDYDWVVYIALIVVSFTIAVLFQSYMIRLTFKFGNKMGLEIYNKLRFTNYEDYVKLGEEKVRTVMMDVAVLQRFPSSFLESFNAAIMVIIGIGYLFWIDVVGAAFVTAIMALLAGIYIYRNARIEKDLDKARELGNIYMKNVNDFLRGFKEVKMSFRRNDNIFKDFLVKNRNNYIALQIKSTLSSLGNTLMGSYAWYLMIGVVLFLLPIFFGMNMQDRTNFLVTLLFIMGPVNVVIGLMESFIRMRIAINRLNEFNETINSSDSLKRGHGDLTNINPYFERIAFENTTFHYLDDNNAATFKLKPLNLEIKRGEIIFVTGGNGSGKSTFINLLSGLYIPKAGHIYLNDTLINDENRPFYRDQLSCIFTDNYLFSENYDRFDLSESNQHFMDLLEKMALDEVVQLSADENKVFHKLSKGQQKRMSLIYALLEKKDVFVFDEWAAEQDPQFRKYFYKSIIPELKKLGKTVIAITHDDAYFHCAERIITFNYGEIVADKRTETMELMTNQPESVYSKLNK